VKESPALYCSITGYGFTGAEAGRPGYDILAQAEAGVMSFGRADGGPALSIAIADIRAGCTRRWEFWRRSAHVKNRTRTIFGYGPFDSQLWLANIGSSYLNVRLRRGAGYRISIVPAECSEEAMDVAVLGVGTSIVEEI
jgi:hypothetical protein